MYKYQLYVLPMYKKNHFIVCLNTLNLNFGYEKDNYIARIYENNVKSFEILWVKGGTIRYHGSLTKIS